MVFADDGKVPGPVDDAQIDRAAAGWARRPASEATKESIVEVDQWTVSGLRNVRPLYKYSWPDGQQVYVNGNTAEVGAVHHHGITFLGVSWCDPALALLHPVAEASS